MNEIHHGLIARLIQGENLLYRNHSRQRISESPRTFSEIQNQVSLAIEVSKKKHDDEFSKIFKR